MLLPVETENTAAEEAEDLLSLQELLCSPLST